MRVKEKVIRDLLREMAINGKPEDGEHKSTVPKDLPISVSPQMSVQISSEKPPVEDSRYIPMNSKELSRALSVLAQEVTDENVREFYLDFKNLISRYKV